MSGGGETAHETVVSAVRPRYEGANIRSWIGFKHVMYLADEALLAWFRHRGYGPRRLLRDCGLGIEVTDASVRLPALLEIDDEVLAETRAAGGGQFSVRLRAEAEGSSRVVLSGKFRAVLVPLGPDAPRERPPADLAPVVDRERAEPAEERRDLPLSGRDPEAVLTSGDPVPFCWSWRARYFYCHCSDRVHYSAYIRKLEEIVDRFLESRRLPVGRTLAERGLIPVVSRVRVRSLAPVRMEEIVFTTFLVDEVLKATAYDGRMDCYVRRDDVLRHVATGRILHGYAHGSGPRAGELAPLDADIVAALTGGGGR